MSAPHSGGGVATHRGIEYQDRVAAWIAVRILAEQAASPPWGLPADVTLEFLRCETEQPVDDILVGTSREGCVFIQVKHMLTLERSADSGLASAADQFVRQCIAHRDAAKGRRPWKRALDAQRDRLVLVTGPGTSTPIRQHFPLILQRLHSPASGPTIDDAATNHAEREVLEVVRAHLSHAWRRTMGVDPTEDDLRALLGFLQIQTLDVDPGGSAERDAKDCLRASVLHNPTQADAAWNTLVQACAAYASTRDGADRARLQHLLLDAGIALQAPRSYHDDMQRLREFSQSSLEALADLSTIRIGMTELKIVRQSTVALRDHAETGALVVVGQPGAGKSGALYDLVATLCSEGRDVVFFAVDRLEARSLGALRDEIGLTHNVDEILRNWPGIEPGFLIIDALDAARSDASARTLRMLISDILRVQGRWHVVASIRKFDLRHNTALQRLFSGEPSPEYYDNDFPHIRHLNIPLLRDDELAQIHAQSPTLAELISRADVRLRDLLRVPFNLRLMGELIGSGIGIESLTPIRTQIELLDRYWHERVLRGDSQGDAREVILRRAAEKMVRTRSLRVSRAEVVNDPTGSLPLTEMLSAHVLTEWQPAPDAKPDRYVLTFSHHVLFDYAVARLLLRGVPETAIIDRLQDDHALVLAIRPSLMLHFQHAWLLDSTHDAFWNLTLRLVGAEGVPEIGKLIGPTVAAEMMTQLADCTQVFMALEDPSATSHDTAKQVLCHIVGAVLAAAPTTTSPLVGSGAGPWCELLERASRSLQASVAYVVRPLLITLGEQAEACTPTQRQWVGRAARRLLAFAWQELVHDRWLVAQALEAVCRTFESDGAASAALVRQCLEPQHLANHGYAELPSLAREVQRLIPVDAALVESVYRAAFTSSYHGNGDATTSIGSSRILPLVINRRQLYENAKYMLAGTYSAFLHGAPIQATRALIAVLDAYVAERHASAADSVVEPFDFHGGVAHIQTDYSAIWDAGRPYHNDEPHRMLDSFEKYLRLLSTDVEQTHLCSTLLDIISAENHLAVLWKRVLACGTAAPHTLGRYLSPLAWAMPILTGYDTTVAIGDLLTTVFSVLDTADRERIERAILSIPDAVDQGNREGAESMRNRLLGCLPPGAIVTQEAEQHLHDLAVQGGAPPNEPRVRIVSGAVPYSEADALAQEGVPTEAEPNRRIHMLEQPIKTFAQEYLNTSPTMSAVGTILPALHSLSLALATAAAEGAHPQQCDHAWACLTEACAQIAKVEELSCETEVGAFTRGILLEAAHHPNPVHRPDLDAQFDDHPSWGSPAVRIEAAMGLTWIARYPSCADDAVLNAIEGLSHDAVPAVRYQVASHLVALYRTAPDLMWNIVEHLCLTESSRGVLQGLLAHSLHRLAGPHAARVAHLARVIFDRIIDGAGAKEVRQSCVSIFTGLYLWQDNHVCRDIVFAIADHPLEFPDEPQRIAGDLRHLLVYGPLESSDPQQDAVRTRAFTLLGRVLRSVVATFHAREQEHADIQVDALPEDTREQLRSLARLADTVGREVYFGSGAYNDKGSGGDGAKVVPGTEERQRFLREAGPILDDLAELGFPSLVHHLLETLAFLIIANPEEVFLRIGRVVRAGKAGGYQYESLAADLIVQLVERYLAEYPFVLRDNSECQRVLLEILDTFVQVGWPSARRLTYRMEEIFW